MITHVDVAIIGGGVAGLYSAYMCSTVGLACHIFEALPYIGGQCIAFYPNKPIYGVPGLHKIPAGEFVKRLSEQCLTDNVVLHMNASVSITKSNGSFEIIASNNQKFDANYIIIASGIGVMKPSIPVSIKGVTELANNSDFVQCYCLNPELYAGQKVVVAGGGNSAIDHAICISKIAKSVTLLHKRDNFSCDKNKIDELNKINNGNIDFKMNHQILELQQGVIITDKEVINTDRIVFCYGLHVNSDNIQNTISFTVKMERNLIKVEQSSMKTSENACYAVGDVVSYPGKTRGILSCCYEAQTSVSAISKELSGGI